MSRSATMALELKPQITLVHSQGASQLVEPQARPRLSKLQLELSAISKRVLGEDYTSPVSVQIASPLRSASAAVAPCLSTVNEEDEDEDDKLSSIYGSSTATRSIYTKATPTGPPSPSSYAVFAALNPYDFDVENLADRLEELVLESSAAEEDRQATPTPAKQEPLQEADTTEPATPDAHVPVAAEKRPGRSALQRQLDAFRTTTQRQSGEGIALFGKKVTWAKPLFSILGPTGTATT
ncbi:hypothetical protein O1611_g9495 [Lasiodiplodia mahajangana]|uniref:Uncharacterized protein n=1 Tax=Lasiodiplodia mahajangana TaxID=1108764 RepID=A0ACC2J940_9PEZI|nr:hypothetical protein O1611_g9495 [Lasiodiplodia mahajangana]